MTSRQVAFLLVAALVGLVLIAPAAARALYWLSAYQTAGTVMQTGGALLGAPRKSAAEPQKRWLGFPRPQVDVAPGAARRHATHPAAPSRREFDPRLADPKAPSRFKQRERRLERRERLGRD